MDESRGLIKSSNMGFLLISSLLLLLDSAATVTARSVFAHVVVGIMASYDQAGWAREIADAKASGVDAFALNIGKDSYTDAQLGHAYAAAAQAGFKAFLSFDFAYYSLPADAALVAATVNKYASSPAQFTIGGKPLVTTFAGDGQDWSGVKSRASIFLAPSWADAAAVAGDPMVDGGYPWNAWGTVNNRGVPNPAANLAAQDDRWRSALGGKLYFAPISPWFFTHYPPSSFDKNWVFPTEDLFLTRWQRMLDTAPAAVFQLTWNDYSESTYVAPLRSDPNLYPAGASAWTTGMPHDGFRLIQNAYARAYKAGAARPVVAGDNIVYWYRIQSRDAVCNDPTGRPDAYQYVNDTLFVVTLLTAPARLTVTTGGRPSTSSVPAGAAMTKVHIKAGQQAFKLARNGTTVLSGVSPKAFTAGCPSNVYNFNAYVGKL